MNFSLGLVFFTCPFTSLTSLLLNILHLFFFFVILTLFSVHLQFFTLILSSSVVILHLFLFFVLAVISHRGTFTFDYFLFWDIWIKRVFLPSAERGRVSLTQILTSRTVRVIKQEEWEVTNSLKSLVHATEGAVCWCERFLCEFYTSCLWPRDELSSEADGFWNEGEKCWILHESVYFTLLLHAGEDF